MIEATGTNVANGVAGRLQDHGAEHESLELALKELRVEDIVSTARGRPAAIFLAFST